MSSVFVLLHAVYVLYRLRELISVDLLPSKGIHHFGLMLLDIYFTKDELARSLIIPSTRSPKPALSQHNYW